MSVTPSDKSIQTDEEIKQAVRERYARRVTEQSSCCGPAASAAPSCGCETAASSASSCGCEAVPSGTLAKLAHYSSEQIADLPADAVENSFGCGNPLAFAGVQPGQTVLDIGSGAGIDVLIASKIVGPTGKAIGLDMTPEMIAKAWANAVQAGATNVDFRLGDADQMPVADSSVDWVISNCVINLAPDKGKVFSEIFRVLKPGGRVSISDIVTGDLPDEIKRNLGLWSCCVGGALKEEEYLQTMRDAGLTDVEVNSRQVYDESVVQALIKDNFSEASENEVVKGLLARNKEIASNIWSAKVVATKPTDAKSSCCG